MTPSSARDAKGRFRGPLLRTFLLLVVVAVVQHNWRQGMLQQRVLLALPSPDSSSPQQQHSKHIRQPHLPNLTCTPRYWDEPCAIRSRCVPYIDEESRYRIAPRTLQKGAFAAERGRGPIGAKGSQRAQRPTTKTLTTHHHSSQVNREEERQKGGAIAEKRCNKER